MKKIGFIVAFLTVLFTSISVSAIEGEGTKESPYLIYTAEEAEIVADFPNMHYKLMNDIKATRSFGKFSGVFDGNGHTVDRGFGTNSGVIKNVTFDFSSGAYGIVGTNNEEGLIENCVVYNGTVAGTNNGTIRKVRVVYNKKIDVSVSSYWYDGYEWYAGGLCKYNGETGVIEYCSFETSSFVYCGAFSDDATVTFGGIAGSNSGLINGCFVVADGELYRSGGKYARMYLIAYNTTSGKIKNCYSKGHIEEGAGCGSSGITSQYGRVENCYTLRTTSRDMGVIGYAAGGPIGGAYTVSSYYVGGTSALALKMKQTYVDWDFENIWAIDENVNDGYPYIRQMPPMEYVAVDSIELETDMLNLYKGDVYSLGVTVLPENATNKTVVWTSSDTDVVEVVGGVLTAKGKGTATITAKISENNLTDTCMVTVSESIAVTSVELDKYSLELNVGETEYINASVLPYDATNKDVVWTVSDTDVATIITDGTKALVLAKSEGEAIVRVECESNGKYAEAKIVVNKIQEEPTEDPTEEPTDEPTGEEENLPCAKINIGSATVTAGDNVTIPISISENPGIAGFKVKVHYDSSILTPVSISMGEILTTGTLTSNIQQNGDLSSLEYVSAFWTNPANITNDGEILLVTFKVKDTAEEGVYPITLTYEYGDVTNQNYDDVTLEITNGSVEVTSVMIGDVFKDGKVNTKDSVRLNQYLADWDIEFTDYEQTAADIYEDGKINTKDSVKLNQYLADWDVELASLFEVGERKITFEAGNEEVVDGYVDIPVMITENDGVAGFKLRLNYDNTILTPVSITVGDALTAGTLTSNIQQSEDLSALEYVSAFWSSSSNVTSTGIAFTVRFKSKDGITENVPVTLSYVEGDICDQDYNDLVVTLDDGSVIDKKAMDYTVNSLAGEVINGKFYAEVEVAKNTDRAEKDMIVIAVYKDGIMVDMVYMKANFNKGQTVSFGGMLEGVEGATLKAFVWDGMTGMKSLSNTIEN